MGTPEFAVPSLKTLVSGRHSILAVVTQPDRPRGRGRKPSPSPVKAAAVEARLSLLQPERASTPSFIEAIRERKPDIIVVVAFGQILSGALLSVPRWGGLNIHASLLPKYRGAAPIQRAILNSDPKTGLTAMRMAEGLDSGPILLQEEVAILPDETMGALHDRLAGLAGSFLLRTLHGMSDGRLTESPQDEAAATYAAKVDRSMGRIQWDTPSDQVSAVIRAFDPWPGAYTTFKGTEIKLFAGGMKSQGPAHPVPGRIAAITGNAVEVETADGIVFVRALQVAGKRRLCAADFLRGFPLLEGQVLGTG